MGRRLTALATPASPSDSGVKRLAEQEGPMMLRSVVWGSCPLSALFLSLRIGS